MPGVTLRDRAEMGVVPSVTSRIQKIHVQILGIVNCKKVLYRLGFCLWWQITITHFQRYSNPSPSAVRHESQICYDSAIHAPSNLMFHFL